MRAAAVLTLAGAAALGGCLGSGANTHGSWSCRIPKGLGVCASIADIDKGATPSSPSAGQGESVLAGAPYRWWEAKPRAVSDGAGPRREGDQVVRVVFAPWVDMVGDYHARSEVFAVVRKSGWWAPERAPSEARLAAGLAPAPVGVTAGPAAEEGRTP